MYIYYHIYMITLLLDKICFSVLLILFTNIYVKLYLEIKKQTCRNVASQPLFCMIFSLKNGTHIIVLSNFFL